MFGIKNSTPEIAYAQAPEKKSDAIEIVIVSDNHGHKELMEQVLERHNEADYFLHAGDSNLKPTEPVMLPFKCVRGNTDFMLPYEDEIRLTLPTGDIIDVMHGHLHRVNGGVHGLIARAHQKETFPHIICYGHTHIVDVQQIDGKLIIINPGSITSPRGGILEQTYALLHVTKTDYDVYMMNAKSGKVLEMHHFDK